MRIRSKRPWRGLAGIFHEDSVILPNSARLALPQLHPSRYPRDRPGVPNSHTRAFSAPPARRCSRGPSSLPLEVQNAVQPGASRMRRIAGSECRQRLWAEPPAPEVCPSHCSRTVPPSLLATNGTLGPAPGDSGPAPGNAPRRRPLPLAECTTRGRPGPRPCGHYEANAKNGPVPNQSFGAAQRAEAQLLVRPARRGREQSPFPPQPPPRRLLPQASQVAGPPRGPLPQRSCGSRLIARISF